MSDLPLFLYGTLRDRAVLEAVLGRQVAEAELTPALLPDHAAREVMPGGWPLIRPEAGAVAPGLLFAPALAERLRLDYYELGYGYRLRATEARRAEGTAVRALVYFPPERGIETGGPWNLADWQARDGGLAAEAASEYMSFFGIEPTESVALRYPQMLARAQSRLAARTACRPQRLHSGLQRAAIEERAARRPYARFFSVEERDLMLPGLGGARITQQNRAAFVAVDAVMVLPYDPVRDRVLVVEQFRIGAYLRGDPHPWTLEPVAGRRDSGESPEETARREALEEAGVRIVRLEKIAEYYPSP
ncbi:MAG: tellurium resistance protein, partial [Alphaproteobacteria bacterium HGW-Alphaproteobacteria-2]